LGRHRPALHRRVHRAGAGDRPDQLRSLDRWVRSCRRSVVADSGSRGFNVQRGDLPLPAGASRRGRRAPRRLSRVPGQRCRRDGRGRSGPAQRWASDGCGRADERRRLPVPGRRHRLPAVCPGHAETRCLHACLAVGRRRRPLPDESPGRVRRTAGRRRYPFTPAQAGH
jgi:hypothetical protein